MSSQCLGMLDLLQSPGKGCFDSHLNMRVSHRIETRVCHWTQSLDDRNHVS